MEIKQWEESKTKDFWGEIAPNDHVLQIYEDDNVLMELLTGFVGGGIKSGNCVIVIVTKAHLKDLDQRLRREGFNMFDLILRDQFIPLDAEETLAKFMINDWPDENLFRYLVAGLIQRARVKKRSLRAFGEMVAILWAKGHTRATVQLEHLWNQFCEKEELCLFCAYPKSGFTKNAGDSLMHICGNHTKMIARFGKAKGEIVYKNLRVKATT